jgi:hypothetical protein
MKQEIIWNPPTRPKDAAHGLLSKDHKVIGFCVHHVAPDRIK